MSKSDKILTPEYLDWHAKLTGLPSVLTDRIQSSLYKEYEEFIESNAYYLSKLSNEDKEYESDYLENLL